MKTPAELAARLRKMVLAAQHHYSPTGEPLRSIVVSPEWLEDMADAANALDSATVADVWDEAYRQGVADERTSEANIGIAGFSAKVNPARQNPYRGPGLADLIEWYGDAPEVSGRVVSANKF